MNKIKILPPEIAQKIAAGEVVERPANILKELIENSIDAGATEISIDLYDGGKEKIIVTDNGCGMTPDDALRAFLPHATSKLTQLDDLLTLQSFGFRGEALASIAAVSAVTLITKNIDAGEDLGTKIKYAHGSIIDHPSPHAMPPGTSITVENLFETIPARKKFLRAADTEWNQCLALLHACIFAHHAIHFKLFKAGSIILNCPPAQQIQERISQVWPLSLVDNMIKLEPHPHYSWLTMHGLISDIHHGEYSRSSIFFFVNNRWIKNQDLAKALIKGYSNVLPPGRFPAGILFISVDQGMVDINIHPKKEDVRFLKPATVHTTITQSVVTTLERHVQSKFQTTLQPAEHSQPISDSNDQIEALTAQRMVPYHQPRHQSFVPRHNDTAFSFLQARSPSTGIDHDQPLLPHLFNQSFDQDIKNNPLERDLQTSTTTVHDFVIIGQLFSTYIMVQQNNELIIVDAHAAHERILYESMKHRYDHIEGTQLLFPHTMHLSPDIQASLEVCKNFLNRSGIAFTIDGPTCTITTAPHPIQGEALDDMIQELLASVDNQYLDVDRARKILFEKIHSQLACKNAIKAGDILSTETMRKLIIDLMACDNRFICVHGRPTIFTITQRELNVKFQRPQT